MTEYYTNILLLLIEYYCAQAGTRDDATRAKVQMSAGGGTFCSRVSFGRVTYLVLEERAADTGATCLHQVAVRYGRDRVRIIFFALTLRHHFSICFLSVLGTLLMFYFKTLTGASDYSTHLARWHRRCSCRGGRHCFVVGGSDLDPLLQFVEFESTEVDLPRRWRTHAERVV